MAAWVSTSSTTGQEDVVLKIGVPHRELTSEIAALKFFDGNGACQLLESDAERGLLDPQRRQRDAAGLDLELLQDLYSGRYEALEMIVLRDLYELLEKVIDRCRDAGNVIFQIALKNGVTHTAASYWVTGNTLHYIDTNGEERSLPLVLVDRARSIQLNRTRGVDFGLPPAG